MHTVSIFQAEKLISLKVEFRSPRKQRGDFPFHAKNPPRRLVQNGVSRSRIQTIFILHLPIDNNGGFAFFGVSGVLHKFCEFSVWLSEKVLKSVVLNGLHHSGIARFLIRAQNVFQITQVRTQPSSFYSIWACSIARLPMMAIHLGYPTPPQRVCVICLDLTQCGQALCI